ncbi:MAG: patatin-like phospholipase family protein [Cyclobacteriaceae bacterium]
MKIGIALSGGGALGAAHVGALKAIEEAELKIHHMTGISAGAIVGALYCSGNSPNDMVSYFEMDSLMELITLKGLETGLVDTDHFQKIIRNHCEKDDLEHLDIKLSIGASNLNKCEFEVFEKGQLSKIAGASAAVPILMKPVTIGKYQYVDGGLINNLLVEPLLETCDFVIGINAHFHKDLEQIEGAKQIAKRCFEIIAGSSVKANGAKCDFFLEIKDSCNYALFDFKHSEELFDIGYREMSEVMEDLKKQIEK